MILSSHPGRRHRIWSALTAVVGLLGAAALAASGLAGAPAAASAAGQAAAPSSGSVPYANIPGTTLVQLTPAKLAQCPWLNPVLPVSQRVQMLLSKMSLSDKIGLMYNQADGHGYEGYVEGQPSLCIPALISQDDSAGVGSGATNVTQLPDPETLAAAWDPDLAYTYGRVNGIEHWGKGIDMVLGPTINMDRLPVWGRSFEVFGEDPYLTGQLGVAETDGIQSEGVMAQVKHWDVYNQEANRNTVNDDDVVSEQTMQEIYMQQFHDVITEADPAAVMCAYSSPNGEFSCNNSYLSQVMRSQWNYQGIVASDYGATHSTAAPANADMNIEQGDGGTYYSNGLLAAAVQDGQVSMSTINTLVGETLTQMFRFGLFNRQPTGTTSSVVDTPAHAALALKVAEQGTVLLKNSGNLLPFGSSTGSIAVIGTQAGANPTQVAGGSAHVNPPFQTSPCTSMAAQAPSGVTVTCDSSNDPATAATAAAAAKAAVVVVQDYEAEGSDLPTTLALPGSENALIEAVAQANPHTVVVLNSGTPVVMPWLSSVQSVVFPGYPGEEDGNAIAAILYGTVDPSGHLTMTFPASYSQTPASTPAQYPGVDGKVDYAEGNLIGYRWYDAKNLTPLFPFGYGLSYTQFAFSNLRVSPSALPVAGVSGVTSQAPPACASELPAAVRGAPGNCPVTVTATITNTGSVAGSDVAQLYLGDPASAGEPPRQLEGFQKVALAPGQSKQVTFHLGASALEYWDSTANGFVVAPGKYRVYVGDSSALANLPLQGSFSVAQSTGPQIVTVHAASTLVAPGTYQVPVTVTNDSGVTDHDVRVTLGASTGYAAAPEQSAAALLHVSCGGPGGRGGGPGCAPIPAIAPGQTATATFTVTVPANAPEGSYQLTGTATGQAPGGQVTMQNSATVQFTGCCTLTLQRSPSSSAVAVQATYANVNGNLTAHDVQLSLSVPSGLTATPVGSTTFSSVAPGGTATATWDISGPTSTPGAIQATAGYTVDGQAQTLQSGNGYLSLAAAYDNTGISDNSDPSSANLDGDSDSYSEQSLEAAGLSPGTAVTEDGVSMTWPDVAAGQPDNVELQGQTLLLTASGSTLGLLGIGDFGEQAATGTITYTDGTTQTFTLTYPDWFTDAVTGTSDQLVATGTVNAVTSTYQGHKVGVYAAEVPLQPGKTIASITLPDDTDMHIFATSIG
jgi:beta-glucosidase